MQIKVKEIKSKPSDCELFVKFYELGEKLALETYGGSQNG